MFCKNCGKELADECAICPYCGTQVGDIEYSGKKNDELCTMALVGFILSFFMSVAGLVCSIIGYKKCRNEGLPGKSLALAGIIISAVELGVTLISGGIGVILFCTQFFWLYMPIMY